MCLKFKFNCSDVCGAFCLRGMVCDCCGHTLQGRSQNGRISYFCQYGSKKRYEGAPEHRNTIAGNIIEPLVWDAIAELLKHPNQIFAAWDSQSEDREKPDQLTRLQKRLTKVERQWERLLDAFQDGLIEKSDLSSRKNRLDQERQILTEQIAHLQRHEMQQQVKEQVLQDFIAYCDTIQGALNNPTPQVKQEVLRLLIKEIVVGKDIITIKHIIPIDDFSRLLPRGLRQKIPQVRDCESYYLT